MHRCLELAKKGIGTTAPNPSVGCVIVHQNTIIGEGYTSPYGGHHAEVNAIQSVKNISLLKQATLYVTLEPCSHFGKTPPCSDLIIRYLLKKVVIGCIDPNPLVAGLGIKRLKEAGIEVETGILASLCKEHHKRFFKFQEKKRPYIILKWAKTLDNFIAPLQQKEKKPVWISNKYARQLSHKWRSQEQAILVGTHTVLKDNPSLTTRDWAGSSPIRLIIDKDLKIPKSASVFNLKTKTIIITQKKESNTNNIIFEQANFNKNLPDQICNILYKHQIISVIIEGGAVTIQSFINTNLWDEARIFMADILFKEGIKEPNIKGQLCSKKNIDTNQLIKLKNDC